MSHKHYLRTGSIILTLSIIFLLGHSHFASAQDGGDSLPILRNPYVSPPVAPADTTGLPPAPPPTTNESAEEIIRPLLYPPKNSKTTEENTSSTPSSKSPSMKAPSAMPATIITWEGISHENVSPPDTTGQVGPNHYVQMINNSTGARVRIWKKDGTQLYDFLMRDLWPSGDACHDDAAGDPVVLYDHMADRWLLTQFAPDEGFLGNHYYECIAVSKGGTPTNVPDDWWLYSIEVSDTKFNDYPKFGIWPDGYYMSANQFQNNLWAGVGVWVFDRSAMLNGNSAASTYFDLGNDNETKYYSSLLPSNLTGDILPPLGAPNYFMSVDMNWDGDDDILHIWEFHTDWNDTDNTTFSLVKDIVVDSFDWNIDKVPQPDTDNKLDAIADRLMMHLWYRNYGDHESLVVNHTIDVGGDHAGIRWYEIRGGVVNTTLSDANIYQQGDYAPDATHRWMGSAAMDRVGNMAIGFSVSDATDVYPGIRYAGRYYNDPLNQLAQGEAVLVDGDGSETGTNRWGDYSAISVDPQDDCTFWYTSEYVVGTGDYQWQTRIGSFKFPNCCGGSVSDVDGLTVEKSSSNVILRWNAARGVSEYRIYKSTDDPYFTPDNSTFLTTVDRAITYYTDNNATGSSSENYYYKVMAVDSCPPEAANYIERVGEFDFDLVPGSN